MIEIVIFMAGAFAAAQDPPAPAPNLPYLKNPSISYGECVADFSHHQANPRVEVIGAGPCRQPRAVLWSAIRYHVAFRWSSLADSKDEAARIDAQIDSTARSIMESYEADLQRWLDASTGQR